MVLLDSMCPITYPQNSGRASGASCRRFRPKHPLEARLCELHADEFLSKRLRIANMDNPFLCNDVCFALTRSIIRERDADFEVRFDGNVKVRQKGGVAAAKILAGSVFFEGHAVRVAFANAHG